MIVELFSIDVIHIFRPWHKLFSSHSVRTQRDHASWFEGGLHPLPPFLSSHWSTPEGIPTVSTALVSHGEKRGIMGVWTLHCDWLGSAHVGWVGVGFRSSCQSGGPSPGLGAGLEQPFLWCSLSFYYDFD